MDRLSTGFKRPPDLRVHFFVNFANPYGPPDNSIIGFKHSLILIRNPGRHSGSPGQRSRFWSPSETSWMAIWRPQSTAYWLQEWSGWMEAAVINRGWSFCNWDKWNQAKNATWTTEQSSHQCNLYCDLEKWSKDFCRCVPINLGGLEWDLGRDKDWKGELCGSENINWISFSPNVGSGGH